MLISTEIYQYLFISSIIFMLYVIADLSIKMYGRFKLNKETVFVLNKVEKIILWISISIFFTYLIK